MRKKLIITTLLLSILLISCGKSEATTEPVKEETEIASKTKVEDEKVIDIPDDLDVDVSYYGALESEDSGDESSVSLATEPSESVFVLNATCPNVESLNKYADAVLKSDVDLGLIELNDGEHYLFISPNGKDTEPTVLFGDSADSYQMFETPDWYNPSATDDAINSINLLYHEAVGGNMIGVDE